MMKARGRFKPEGKEPKLEKNYNLVSIEGVISPLWRTT